MFAKGNKTLSIENKRKVLVQKVIITLVIIMIMLLGPLNKIQHRIISKPANVEQNQTFDMQKDNKLLQTYTPIGNHIECISLYLDGKEAVKGTSFTFVLYDSEYAPVFSKEILVDEIKDGILTIDLNLDVTPGLVCYYELLIPEESGRIQVSLVNREASLQGEAGVLFVNGEPDFDNEYRMEINYKEPLSLVRMLFYIAVVVLFAMICYVISIILITKHPHVINRASRIVHIIFTVILVGLSLVTLYFAVYKNYFGGANLDRIVYAGGIIFLSIFCVYYLWYGKQKKIDPDAPTTISDSWKNYLQAICFGGAIFADCMYANATEMKLQYENTRWMMIFFGLSFMVSFVTIPSNINRIKESAKNEQIKICVEAIVLILSVIAGAIFVKNNNGDSNTIYLAKLLVAVWIIWGIVILHTILHLKKDIVTRLNPVQVGIFVLFVIGIVVNRYHKVWPFEILIPAVIMLLQNYDEKAKNRMIHNLCDGIYLAFAVMTIYGLLYRPFMKWTYYRYMGYFHTVACTGMFLAVVVCVALCKFYIRAHKSKNIIIDTYVDLMMIGASTIYILLSMSRTAIMAMVALYIGIVILTTFVYKKKYKRIILEIGIVLGIIVLSFPVVYSATRMVPSLVKKPFHFEPVEPSVEVYNQMLTPLDEPDSSKYMSMERFITLFSARIKLPEELLAGGNEKDKVEQTEVTKESEQIEDSDVIQQTDSIVDEEAENTNTFEVSKGLTNGRADIFKTYLKHLNLMGHESMGYQSEDGSIDYGHAHNSYIQVFYDFGIIVGMIFLIFCLVTFIHSIMYVIDGGETMQYRLVLYGIILIFGVISVTEWAFHPSIPVGFTFLWAQDLLLTYKKVKNKGISEKE